MSPADGFINADAYQTPAADVLFDCQQVWPFPDNCFDTVASIHVLEHLDDFKSFFRESWRVLRPHGQLNLQLPHGATMAAWSDVDHKRPWFPASFAFLQPGYGSTVRNAQHRWDAPFTVLNVGVRLNRKAAWWARLPIINQWFLRHLDVLTQYLAELIVWLEPIKSQEALQAFHENRQPNFVPVSFVMLAADYGRTKELPSTLITIGRAGMGFSI